MAKRQANGGASRGKAGGAARGRPRAKAKAKVKLKAKVKPKAQTKGPRPEARRTAKRSNVTMPVERDRVRWAVVGLGHFAQTAVLPAFAHAEENAQLVAIFSDDEKKRRQLGKKYQAAFALPYEEYDDFLRSGEVDAVYLVVPNHEHCQYTVRAARAGIHVLCEKPMAPTSDDCRAMIEACADAQVKLMIGYRLHFEEANLTVVDRIKKGAIGDPRYFSSAFSFQLDEDNVRTMPTDQGGGPLFDIGPYCINAARYLFRAEPESVIATAVAGTEKRFADTEEQVSAVLTFPEGRLATFTVGFGSADVATYTVAGTKGSITLDSAYSHAGERYLTERVGGREKERTFPKADQIAPELVHFSTCVLEDAEPGPSGWEGYHDVRIIEAVLESARTGRAVSLDLRQRDRRPSPAQMQRKPPAREETPIEAAAPRAE